MTFEIPVTIAFVDWGTGLIDLSGLTFCVIAALIATNIESVIGATVQAKVDWLTNEVVRYILIALIGAMAAVLLALVWQHKARLKCDRASLIYLKFDVTNIVFYKCIAIVYNPSLKTTIIEQQKEI